MEFKTTKYVLIETLWNVKIYDWTDNDVWLFCINRNIVECKVVCSIKYSFFSPSGINRNIVECKENCRSLESSIQEVLIETLWNVKSQKVLLLLQANSINRNIVECKGRYFRLNFRFCLCINRNIVECKERCAHQRLHRQVCINRNIVECKAAKWS